MVVLMSLRQRVVVTPKLVYESRPVRGVWKSVVPPDSADGRVATAEEQCFSERNLLLFLPCRLRGQQKAGHTSDWNFFSLSFLFCLT